MLPTKVRVYKINPLKEDSVMYKYQAWLMEFPEVGKPIKFKVTSKLLGKLIIPIETNVVKSISESDELIRTANSCYRIEWPLNNYDFKKGA